MNFTERNFKNRLPLIAFSPFRFINVTYKSTRQVQLSQFWIFCNFFGYFVHRSYITIFRMKLCKNLNAKFKFRLRFLFETLNLARKILNRPIAMAVYRSTFFSLRVMISVVVAAFGRLLLRSQLKVERSLAFVNINKNKAKKWRETLRQKNFCVIWQKIGLSPESLTYTFKTTCQSETYVFKRGGNFIVSGYICTFSCGWVKSVLHGQSKA